MGTKLKHLGALSIVGVLVIGAVVLLLASHRGATSGSSSTSSSSSSGTPTATLAPTYITVNLPSPPTSTAPTKSK